MSEEQKIGFGGNCHWCTEAVFQSLRGVVRVDQGWIAAEEAPDLHEAVIVHYNQEEIPLEILVEVHLRTHNSTSDHFLRRRYRSAVYSFSEKQKKQVAQILSEKQVDFEKTLVTQAYRFKSFLTSEEGFKNYYLKNPEKPFCKSYIDPKLKIVTDKFAPYLH